MSLGKKRGGFLLPLAVMASLTAAGCNQADEQGAEAKNKGGHTQVNADQVATNSKEHDHSGWWCDEHGVPEAICGQCSDKYAAECKKKGDWCQQHDRPDSQCFIRHPELKEKFAAEYRAKYGKEPPPIEEETPKKDGKD